MAKRKRKVLPARRKERDDDSLLVRSAESLGRVIGTLQRQLQGSSKRASAIADDALKTLPDLPRLDTVFGGGAATSRKRKAVGTRRTTGTRARSTARKSAKKR